MRYSGIQPQYFPRLHYFARILNADMYVIRDDCQFVRKHKYPDGMTGKSYQVQAPIKTANGVYFLTAPIKHNGYQLMTEVAISYEGTWVTDQLKTIQLSYQKAPYSAEVLPQLTEVLKPRYPSIADLNIATILWGILRLLGEQTITADMLTISYVEEQLSQQDTFRLKKIIRASETETAKSAECKKNDRIISLCKELGATEDYCGGTATSAYVDTDQFTKNGITITVQDWTCQEYPQVFMKQQGFLANLSVIDLLMHVSPERAREIMKGEKPTLLQSSVTALSGSLPAGPELITAVSDIMIFL